MAARAAPGGNNTYMMSPAVTLERSSVVRFGSGHSIDTPRSPIAEKLNSHQSGLHKRASVEIRSEGEPQDPPRKTKEGLIARILSYKWKGDAKGDGKDIC